MEQFTLKDIAALLGGLQSLQGRGGTPGVRGWYIGPHGAGREQDDD